MSTRIKTATKDALCALYKYSGAAPLQEAYLRASGQASMVILLFHRVTDDIPEDGLTVGTARFRAMCRMLRNNFRVVPLADIFHIACSGESIPPQTVAITFDDSYQNNLPAARVLAEHHLPATFFIPAAYVATDHVYDWDRDLPVRLPNLTWDEVVQMAELGHEIGSHTMTHPNMASLSNTEALKELIDSKKLLENKLGRSVRWFAYPFGNPEHFRTEQLALVKEAGYEGCLSAHGGFIRRHESYPILPREPVPYFDSVLNLELYLRGCLHWFYSAKKSLRFLRSNARCASTPKMG